MIKFHQPGFPANDWDFKISAKRLKPASLVVTKKMEATLQKTIEHNNEGFEDDLFKVF